MSAELHKYNLNIIRIKNNCKKLRIYLNNLKLIFHFLSFISSNLIMIRININVLIFLILLNKTCTIFKFEGKKILIFTFIYMSKVIFIYFFF